MSFKRYLILSLSTLVLGLVSFSCTDENSDLRQEERMTKWIDARRYSDVIRVLEPEIESKPEWKTYLGEAYLGQAGFEPFLLAARVMGHQNKGTDSLEKLFPHCSVDSLQDFDRVPVPCVIKRLIQQLPDARDSSLKRGLNLLISAHPRAELAPVKINILIGSVALGSAISRLGSLLTYYDGLVAEKIGKTEIDHLFSTISSIAVDANQVLTRANYANDRITSLLTGLKSVRLLNRVGSQVQFDPGTGLSTVIGLADAASKDLETNLLKVLIIQNLDRLVEEFKRN